MSQYGAIKVFSEHDQENVPQVLQDMINICTPGRVDLMFRHLVLSEWAKHLAYLYDEEEDEPDDESEDLPRCPVEQVPSLYVPGQVLHVSFGNSSPLGAAVYQAHVSMPKQLRGDFHPWNLSVTVGPHDLYDPEAETEEGYYGRAFLSVGVSGNGTPADWEAYRRVVWTLPAVRDLVDRLSAVLPPPVKTCAFWSV